MNSIGDSDSDNPAPVLPASALPVALAATSVALAVGQFLILRHEARGAGLWIPYSGVAFVMAVTVMMFGWIPAMFILRHEAGPIVGAVIAGAAAGWLYGTMTGSVLNKIQICSPVVT